MTTHFSAPLARLVLDVARTDDDEAWDMATQLLDEMDLEAARRTAWVTTLFLARLLRRLGEEHPEALDADDALAEWGLSEYIRTQNIEVTT